MCISCDAFDVKVKNLEKLKTDDCIILVRRVSEPTAFGTTYLDVIRYHDNRFWFDDWDRLCILEYPSLTAELSQINDELLLVGFVSPGEIIIDPYFVMPIDEPTGTLVLDSRFLAGDMDWVDIVETKTHAIEKYQLFDGLEGYAIHAWLKDYDVSHRNFYILNAESVEMMILDDSTLQANVDWNADIERSRFYLRLWQGSRDNMKIYLDSIPAEQAEQESP